MTRKTDRKARLRSLREGERTKAIDVLVAAEGRWAQHGEELAVINRRIADLVADRSQPRDGVTARAGMLDIGAWDDENNRGEIKRLEFVRRDAEARRERSGAELDSARDAVAAATSAIEALDRLA